MADNERARIKAGMGVIDANGTRVGSLRSILNENETGVSRFITVDERVLPVESIDTVENDEVRLAIGKDRFVLFPEREGEGVPSVEMLQRAYDVLGLQGPGTTPGLSGSPPTQP